jgi:Helicase conserved C-terminal domain
MPRYKIIERVSTAEAFQSLKVDDLKPLARLITDTPPSRKMDLAELVTEAMRDAAQVRKFYREMKALNQAAVQEATHECDGTLDGSRFQAKYGQAPDFGSGRNTTALRLFFPGWTTLPKDLQQTLQTFVPQPQSATVRVTDELPESIEQRFFRYDLATNTSERGTAQVPIQVRETERAAQHDLMAVLRLIDAGKVSVSATTRRPGQAALKTIAAVLQGGDFYTDDEFDLDDEERADLPIKAFAWPLIVQAAGFANLSGTRLQLTAAGRKAAALPAHEGLRTAWDRWQSKAPLDEFNRVNVIKGQGGKGKAGLTAVARRRETVADALAGCPVDEWIAIDEFFRFMQAAGHHFEVTRNPWSLYISEQHYGNLGYSGYHDWEILQGRYTMALLFEYAATMGLVDVAYISPALTRRDYRDMWGTDDLSYLSRYDGLLYFRLNRLGAWILDEAERYEPAPVKTEPVLKVLPNLEVALTGPALPPGDALLLERFAEHTSEAVWRLSTPRCLAAVEEGASLAELHEFLRTRSSVALPQTVEVFISDLKERTGRLRDLGAARLIECADPELALLIAHDRRLRDICRIAGDRQLVFRAADEPAVRRALRELGYVLPPV